MWCITANFCQLTNLGNLNIPWIKIPFKVRRILTLRFYIVKNRRLKAIISKNRGWKLKRWDYGVLTWKSEFIGYRKNINNAALSRKAKKRQSFQRRCRFFMRRAAIAPVCSTSMLWTVLAVLEIASRLIGSTNTNVRRYAIWRCRKRNGWRKGAGGGYFLLTITPLTHVCII